MRPIARCDLESCRRASFRVEMTSSALSPRRRTRKPASRPAMSGSESSPSFSRALIALVSKPMVGSGDIAQHCSALLALLHLVNSGFRFGARICRGEHNAGI